MSCIGHMGDVSICGSYGLLMGYELVWFIWVTWVI